MSTVQVNSGSRNMVIPGARIVRIVVMKLTAPRMVPKPPRASPKTHRSPPMPGLLTALERGAYAVQPNAAAPVGVRKPAAAMRPPKR